MSRFIKAVLILIILGGTGYAGYRHFMHRSPAGEAPGAGMMPPAQVSVITVSAKDTSLAFEYVGQVAGSREVEVRARVTGIIEKRFYEEGQHVSAGTTLFKIDPAIYSAAFGIAKAGLAQAEARASQAEREYNRIAPLLKTQAVSRKENDDARSALDIARAEVELAKAQLEQAQINLDYTEVKAPISGITGRALKVEGSLAEAMGDSLLTTMAQIDPVYINFSVPEAEHLRLRQEIDDGLVTVAAEGIGVRLKKSAGGELPQTGKVDFNDYKADSRTGSFAMRATVPNPDGTLAPGQFVRVSLTGLTRKMVVSVPQRAVMEGPAGKFVYTVGKDGKGGTIALPQPVKVGEWVNGAGGENEWIVYEGLKSGTEIVLDGTARIFFPGAPIVVMPPGGVSPAATGHPSEKTPEKSQ